MIKLACHRVRIKTGIKSEMHSVIKAQELVVFLWIGSVGFHSQDQWSSKNIGYLSKDWMVFQDLGSVKLYGG